MIFDLILDFFCDIESERLRRARVQSIRRAMGADRTHRRAMRAAGKGAR